MTVTLVYKAQGDKAPVKAVFRNESAALAQAAADAAAGREPLEVRDESGDNVLVGNAEIRKAAKE